jgi:hypothetical protein
MTAGVVLAAVCCVSLFVAALSARQIQHVAAAVSQGTQAETATPGATVSPAESPTPYPEVTVISFADCAWGATAQAFDDRNGNGKWDKGEPPLAGVNFQIDDVLNNFQGVAFTDEGKSLTSGKNGTVNMYVGLPGCPDVKFEVYAVPPAGYVPTTPERVPVGELDVDETFVFGFKRTAVLPGMPGTGHP